jgi:hypothetical protein
MSNPAISTPTTMSCLHREWPLGRVEPFRENNGGRWTGTAFS